MANQESESPESGKTSVTLRAVVDRIEDGDIAVLMIDADNTQTQLDIPRALLPSETEEGAHLRITIKLDGESRADTTARIRSLREKLLKGK
ncbi:MAG: DUF3006 domain-containing protein [Pyrinomonadaceae bacterium MAG19_C2-C3]|nr:DUF3006 domain-containing protein [Pyrinomonadaceae bacterium MAG19_C2-C3]